MKIEERTYKVYISCDGNEFKRQEDCERWEIENIAEVRQSRVRELLEELRRLKHSVGCQALRHTGERLCKAKAALIAASKFKRRNTLQFAENMARACENYMNAHGLHEARLKQYRDTLAELKEIEPRFDRSKKGLAK